MSSSYMIFRYAFSIINLCFFAFGLSIVVASWWLHLKSSDYNQLLENKWLTAPIILIFSAKVAMFLGIIGCVGAWFEKKGVLFLYILTMVLIFVTLLVGVVLTIALNESRVESTHNNLLQDIRQSKNDQSDFRRWMNSIQRRLQCCGIDDYQDWLTSNNWPGYVSVPESCCKVETSQCGTEIPINQTSTLINTQGCFTLIQMEINRNLLIVGILAFILVIIEGFCIVAALGLLCYLRQRDSYI